MAEIVLGIGTSHTPMLTLPAEMWSSYATRDAGNPELAFPPHGVVMSYDEALTVVPPETRARYRGTEPFAAQATACQRALDELSASSTPSTVKLDYGLSSFTGDVAELKTEER